MYCTLLVQVAVRFRDGERGRSSLVLPLHQRLRMKRSGETLGEREPTRFLDPLLGSLMTNPVVLPTSGRTMDFAVIAAHLRRQKSDPFNGRALTEDMLVPDDALRAEVEEFKRSRQGDAGEYRALHRHCAVDVKRAVCAAAGERYGTDSGTILEMLGDSVADMSPDIVAALMEAELLNGAAARAKAETSRRKGVVSPPSPRLLTRVSGLTRC